MTRPADDHYPTPPAATEALLSAVRFSGTIWEPCAGDGVMLDVLARKHSVVGTTLLPSAHPQVSGSRDLFGYQAAPYPTAVTNPPFKIATEIWQHLRAIGVDELALLLNVKFLASGKRRALFLADPPERVLVFVDRVTMYPAGFGGRKGTTTETFAWFVWRGKASPGRDPRIGWLDSREYDPLYLLK